MNPITGNLYPGAILISRSLTTPGKTAFYQIVEITRHQIKVRKVRSRTDPKTKMIRPIHDDFVGAAFTPWIENDSLKSKTTQVLIPWDGNAAPARS